jgi:hypothetical protein
VRTNRNSYENGKDEHVMGEEFAAWLVEAVERSAEEGTKLNLEIVDWRYVGVALFRLACTSRRMKVYAIAGRVGPEAVVRLERGEREAEKMRDEALAE